MCLPTQCLTVRIRVKINGFFMLDHIYRDAHQRQDVQQSVIVSGDGHYRNCSGSFEDADG